MKVVSCPQDSTRVTLTSQFHNNGDPGFAKKGRDLNRFRCGLNAYRNLHSLGVCEQGWFHIVTVISIDLIQPGSNPIFIIFIKDSHSPRTILLEYLQDTEELNCVNYSDDRLQAAIVGLREIHSALIHHRDVYPK